MEDISEVQLINEISDVKDRKKNNLTEPKSKQCKKFECSICFYEYSKYDLQKNHQNKICCHFIKNICQSCLDNWVVQQIKDQNSIEINSIMIKCPIEKCAQLFQFNQFLTIFYTKQFPLTIDELFNSYCRKKYDLINCPNPNCNYRGIISNFQCQAPLICEKCQHTWKESSQSSFLSSIRNFKELKSNLYKYFFTKNCPTCNVHIQKNGGCNNMTCKRCLTGFCWLCLNPHGKHPVSCSVRQVLKSIFFFYPVIYLYKKLGFFQMIKNYNPFKKAQKWYDYFLFPLRCTAFISRYLSYYAFCISSLFLTYAGGLFLKRKGQEINIKIQNAINSFQKKPQVAAVNNTLSHNEKRLYNSLPYTTAGWLVSGLISYYFGNKNEYKIFLGANLLYASFFLSIGLATLI